MPRLIRLPLMRQGYHTDHSNQAHNKDAIRGSEVPSTQLQTTTIHHVYGLCCQDGDCLRDGLPSPVLPIDIEILDLRISPEFQ